MTLSADRAFSQLLKMPSMQSLRRISPAPGGKGTLLLGVARDSHGVSLRFAIFIDTVTAKIRKQSLLRSPDTYTECANWSTYTDDYETAPKQLGSRKATLRFAIEDLLRRLTPGARRGV